MALKKDKTRILLPRREVLLKGGLGALGMAIGATALPFIHINGLCNCHDDLRSFF